MAEKTSGVSVRHCDFCQKFFHGVDTRRSYLRHLRTKHYGLDPEQVRRVVELGRPEEAVSDVNRGTLSTGLPNVSSFGLPTAASEGLCPSQTVTSGDSTSRLSGSPTLSRTLEELISVEAPESQPPLPCLSFPDEDDELQGIIDNMLASGPGSPVVAHCPSPPPREAFQSEPLDLALTMRPRLPDAERVAGPLVTNERDSQALLGRLTPGCSGTAMMMFAPASPLDPLPASTSASALVSSVPELAPILAWANRLFPPYDYGQFLAYAKRLFPLCSVKMATEVYVNCRLAHERPG